MHLPSNYLYEQSLRLCVTNTNCLNFKRGYRGDGRLYGIEGYNELINEWTTFEMLIHYPIEAVGMVKLSYHEIIFLGGKDDVA